MTAREAAVRVQAFIDQRATLRGLDADWVTAANHAPLLLSDLRVLLAALDQPDYLAQARTVTDPAAAALGARIGGQA